MIRQSLMAILKNGTQLLEHLTAPLTENVFILNTARNKSGILTKQTGFIKKWNVRSLQPHTTNSQAVTQFSRYFSRLGNNEKVSSILRKHCSEYLTLQRSFQGKNVARYFGRPISLVAFGFTAIGFQSGPEDIGRSPNIICSHIKNYFQDNEDTLEDVASQYKGGENVDSYNFGCMIAKGCNAAVYEACQKIEAGSERTLGEKSTELDISFEESNEVNPPVTKNDSVTSGNISASFEVIAEDTSPSQDSTHVSTIDDDSIEVLDSSECDAMLLHNPDNGDIFVFEADSSEISIELDLREDDIISLSATEGSDSLGNLNLQECEPEVKTEWAHDLAIKMMYNYDTSNEMSILTNMKMETLPLRNDIIGIDDEMWGKGNHVKKKVLPPHPNVVEMYHVFFGDVPELESGMEQYPTALPFRLNPDGFGRNKTMFSVMKRYPYTLKSYLSASTPSLEESISLLSQLVDAVAHMVDNGIAHRDLKSDNILVEDTPSGPHLVVCDFGCALADGLVLHLSSDYVSRGGNVQLMAPEIINARPSPSCYIDYSKTDLWAAGSLAYEIFGSINPFDRGCVQPLRNSEYRDGDLPNLPARIPFFINSLIKSMLKSDPKERPTARDASNALHYLRWSHAAGGLSYASDPTYKTDEHVFAPDRLPRSEIQLTRWILLLSAHAILGQRLYKQERFEIEAKKRFLSTVSINELKRGINLLGQCTI